jgi:hypothetical protein
VKISKSERPNVRLILAIFKLRHYPHVAYANGIM